VALFTGLWGQQVLDAGSVDDDAFAAAVVFVGQAVEALGQPIGSRAPRRVPGQPDGGC
jgi:hypothetical protein